MSLITICCGVVFQDHTVSGTVHTVEASKDLIYNAFDMLEVKVTIVNTHI